MRSINRHQIAVAFAGSFLGAGFVSGQELVQFFAVFGTYGIVGMFCAVILSGILGVAVMETAKQTGIIEFDKIIIEKDIKWLRTLFESVFLLCLFGGVVVMVAGAGALFHQVFGIPAMAGNLIMAVLLAIFALWGASGVVAAFSVVVPLLIAAALVISLISFARFGTDVITPKPYSGENPLLGNWFFSMVSFVSYNMMAAIAILIPIAIKAKDKKTIRGGVVLGCVELGIVFFCILLPLILNSSMVAGEEMPTLFLAEKIHPVLGYLYAVLLLGGIFGTALSGLFGVAVRLCAGKGESFDDTEGKRKKVMLFLAVLSLAGSAAGFKQLIGFLFPVFGYIGVFAMIGIMMHYIHLRKQSRR